MKRALEAGKEQPSKKPLADPLTGHNQYVKLSCQKHSRLFTHDNVRGILMSCIQNREGLATHQLLRILKIAKELLRSEFPEFEKFQAISTSKALGDHHQQEYFDKMKAEEDLSSSSEEEQVEAKKAPSSFQVYNAGCKGLVFIGIRHELDAVAFVQRFMELLALPTEETGLKWPEEIVVERILPIQKTSATTERQITEAIKPMIEQHLGEDKEPTTWGIIAHSRNSKEFPRKAIIDLVASLVPSKHPVDLSKPSINIMIEVIKSTCCISFVKDFQKYAKYNPSTFLKQQSPPLQKPQTENQETAKAQTAEDK